MAHEGMDIASLRTFVEREIDRYVYRVPEGAVGTPMPAEWVNSQLAEFRQSLVEPRWETVQVKDTPEQWKVDPPILRQCVLIADDQKGHHLYYDPEQNDFVLAFAGDQPTTFNVRGDAVGCFMAR
jgi:hypothetical protein